MKHIANAKTRILICGILPPPYFGHSMLYKVLMESEFVKQFDVIFLNMHFWSYRKHKKITIKKLFKLIVYYLRFIILILIKRPKYLLYGISFDKMPFVKDMLFCVTGRLLGARIILHDMGQYLVELYASSSPILRRMIRWFIIKKVTVSIVLGEMTKEVYRGYISKEKVIAVPGSVHDTFDLTIPKKRQQSGNNGVIQVLYFSFLSVSKGFLVALQAIPKVIEQNPKVRFVFAGPFESALLQDETDRFIKKNRLEPYIQYLGYVGDELKRSECFRNSDIFIFPTMRDVFGLVLLHAMAEGLPIVASEEGTIPEIIRDGEECFLIQKGNVAELAEKIVVLADNAGLRRKMGERSRQRYLDMYTPQCYVARMIRAFEEIEEKIDSR